MSTHIRDDEMKAEKDGLPLLRSKRKLQSDRYVQFGHFIHHTSKKQKAQEGDDLTVSRLPHMSPGVPCSLSTSIKFAEIVHRNWNYQAAVLPTSLSMKNASMFMVTAPRGGVRKTTGSTPPGLSCHHSQTTWLEKVTIMTTLVSFCTLDSIESLLLLNRQANAILRSDEVWKDIIERSNLTPLLRLHRITADYYDFFRHQIVSTNAIAGLYRYENARPPTARYSFSLPTDVMLADHINISPNNSSEEESFSCEAAQKKYRNVRLLVTPATFGCNTYVFSRAHLLLRKWPPFDQSKVYLGSCRFSFDHRGYLFTFLDEGSEPKISFRSACVYIGPEESGQTEDGAISSELFLTLLPCYPLAETGEASADAQIPRLVLEKISNT